MTEDTILYLNVHHKALVSVLQEVHDISPSIDIVSIIESYIPRYGNKTFKNLIVTNYDDPEWYNNDSCIHFHWFKTLLLWLVRKHPKNQIPTITDTKEDQILFILFDDINPCITTTVPLFFICLFVFAIVTGVITILNLQSNTSNNNNNNTNYRNEIYYFTSILLVGAIIGIILLVVYLSLLFSSTSRILFDLTHNKIYYNNRMYYCWLHYWICCCCCCGRRLSKHYWYYSCQISQFDGIVDFRDNPGCKDFYLTHGIRSLECPDSPRGMSYSRMYNFDQELPWCRFTSKNTKIIDYINESMKNVSLSMKQSNNMTLTVTTVDIV